MFARVSAAYKLSIAALFRVPKVASICFEVPVACNFKCPWCSQTTDFTKLRDDHCTNAVGLILKERQNERKVVTTHSRPRKIFVYPLGTSQVRSITSSAVMAVVAGVFHARRCTDATPLLMC